MSAMPRRGCREMRRDEKRRGTTGTFNRGGDASKRLAGSPLEEAVRNAPVMIAEQDVKRSRQQGDRVGEARALARLGRHLADAGRDKEALNAAEQAVKAARRAGDDGVTAEAGALSVRAAVSRRRRQYEEAITASKAAADLFRAAGTGTVRGRLCLTWA
jgi:hypothetical protein